MKTSRSDRAGFPFFDLYRLVVIARGKRLIADVKQSKSELGQGTSGAALRLFDRLFRYNLGSSPFGWQLVAVARRTERSRVVIITRTPLRITLGGGGTDLPSYYERFGGLVLSAAINRYIYVAINRTFTDDYFLKYARLERVDEIDDIEHPIIREVSSPPSDRTLHRAGECGGHPCQHRTRFFRDFHGRIAPCDLCVPATKSDDRTECSRSVPCRNGSARASGGQAGSIRSRLWRSAVHDV